MRINALFFVLSLVCLSGCDRELDPSKLSQGDELYAYYCQGCHKARGLGDYLENLPLIDTSLKDYEILLVIKYGYNTTHSMPTFSNLSDEQADAIATYLVKTRQQHQQSK